MECAKGCGFFGSAENRNLCSMCYNEYHKSQSVTPPIIHPKIDDDELLRLMSKLKPLKLTKEKVSRCKCCNKKVGLLGFRCRCDELFCERHRLPELHSCEIDYKAIEHRSVAKNPHLTLVKTDKLKYRV